MSSPIVIHIGTHKTGSTAVQKYLDRHRPALLESGCAYYRGSIFPENHVELYLAAMRRDRDSLAKQKLSLQVDDVFVANTRQSVAGFIKSVAAENHVFSCEGLSLLRFDDELATLRSFFGEDSGAIRIVLVLRDRDDYLESYRQQILKLPGRSVSSDPSSALYVEKDSWLADFDALVAVYARHFGAENIQVVDYDAEMQRHGDVLPAVLRAMTVPDSWVPAPGSQARENATTWRHLLQRRFPRLVQILRTLRGKVLSN